MTIYCNTEWDGLPWSDQLTVLEARCGTTGARRSHAAWIWNTVGELRSEKFGNLKPLADYRIVVEFAGDGQRAATLVGKSTTRGCGRSRRADVGYRVRL